jgi:hypothetical protein
MFVSFDISQFCLPGKIGFFTCQAKLDFLARHVSLLPARRGRLSRPDSADFSAVRLKPCFCFRYAGKF